MARKKTPEINASSTADIAFLLLTFFLMTTTMDVDSGLFRRLPPMPPPDQVIAPPVAKRNILQVLVNKNDLLAVNGELMQIENLKEKAKEFILNPQENIMERFEDLITSNIPVLVDFFAVWCGPCKAMKPILEELKGIKGEKVRIVKVDVDKHKEIAAYYQIQSVPTLMIFKDGKQLWRQSGVMRANDLSTILAQYE